MYVCLIFSVENQNQEENVVLTGNGNGEFHPQCDIA